MQNTYCPHCGGEIPKMQRARFCPSCGKALHSVSQLGSNRSSGQTVVSLLQQGQFIEAVKLHRDQSGVGLKQAKHEVEEMARLYQIPLPQTRRALVLLVAAAILLVGIAAVVFMVLSVESP